MIINLRTREIISESLETYMIINLRTREIN
jgi:hypothetical protein